MINSTERENMQNLEQPATATATATQQTLDVSKPAATTEVMAVDEQTKAVAETMSDTTQYRENLKQLPEVKALTDQIDVNDANTVTTFGSAPSEELSKISDKLLKSMKMTNADEANQMLNQLTKIMDKFDIKEVEDPEKAAKKSSIGKLFKKASDNIQKLFEKYDTMGKEVDKIYVMLNQYKDDIMKSNKQLGEMYEANISYYTALEKYIAAGELGVEEIQNYRDGLTVNTNMDANQLAMAQQKLDVMKNMLEQRVYDLRVAENVAMQTSPMIQSMEQSNFNLMMSIQSAFVTTLPIFKNCLISAMQLKQQAIQQQSVAQLNQKTNELLMRNATNNANQSKAIAKMANTSGVSIETLQKSYETIKQGIADTKTITEQMAEQRKTNTDTLENMKSEMKKEGWA